MAAVALWRVDLHSEHLEADALMGRLPPDEQRRAAAYLTDPPRWRFLLCRVALREILAQALGISPEDVKLLTSLHGKPELAQATARLHFNVSHAAALGLIAMSQDAPVGVDVEPIETKAELEPMARYVLSSRELEALRRVPESRRRAEILRLWTLKEAYLKAIGVGLTRSMAELDLEIDLEPGWTLHSLAPQPGYIAAIALKAPLEALRIQDWCSRIVV